jgi:hypothetical protein
MTSVCARHCRHIIRPIRTAALALPPSSLIDLEGLAVPVAAVVVAALVEETQARLPIVAPASHKS